MHVVHLDKILSSYTLEKQAHYFLMLKDMINDTLCIITVC